MTKEKFKFLKVGSIVITNGTCRQNAGIKCVVTYIYEDRIWIRPIDGQKFTSSDNWCSEDWNEVSYKSVSLFIRN